MKATDIPAQVFSQAVEWLLRQQQAPFSADEQQEFQQWLQQSEQHQRAWQCAEYLTEYLNNSLDQLAPQQSSNVLQKAGQLQHQQLLRLGKLLLLTVVVSGLGYWGWQSDLAYAVLAEYRTQVGEQKLIHLSDGSQVYLNTDSAMDTQFNPQQRLLSLHYGEIQIRTAKEHRAQKRPFRVQTPYGTLEALGTVFNVQQLQQQTCVAVLESAVKISPLHLAPIIVRQNQQICFNQSAYQPIQQIQLNTQQWQSGLFSAYDLPLPAFVEQMQRYHRAYYQLDPALAHLTISGSYPLTDPQKTLELLQQTYPISIEQHLKGYVIRMQKR
ncbi:FecR family protein [Acinetobacter larvae]|uniref:FecR protein domain-containing protein n=1 Tax=Acinetobacter larvae TaxID=1789224 RepID=A0A1B2M3J2_9GAMM|nr:FecR domain-containing protein [Acinetobacter larvae]AOA59749.1 hypothetical protein BFG52_16270 [Acinetobacter larvae]